MADKPDGKSRPVEQIIDGLKRYNEWRQGADFDAGPGIKLKT